MDKYQRVSAEIMAILAEFSPLVEPLSVDEAFVDLSGTRALFGPSELTVRKIKDRIRGDTGLTASAGLAANKFVAKVASDLRKPDGLVIVPPGTEASFLAPLPVERLWGVGRVLSEALATMGIATIGQLQGIPAATLERRFGEHGRHLHDLAFGRDDRAVDPSASAKSIGAETTFGVDCRDPERLRRTLRRHAERVARQLREDALAAARVTLKLRYADFRTLTRSHTGDPTQDGLDLYRRTLALLEAEHVSEPVRLIGLSASGLGPAGRGQLSLLDPLAVRRERLGPVVDRLTARFGEGTLGPASLLPRTPRQK